MSISSSLPRLHSPFLSCPLKLSTPNSSSFFHSKKFGRNQRSPSSYPCVRADLDQNSIVAISVGLVSVAVGIGIPVFFETQIDNAAKRENTQPCFPCSGSGSLLPVISYCFLGANFSVSANHLYERCRFCMGTGSITVELGGDEKEVSRCINCDGVGSLTCTTCQGSGIQPRYLDRREYKDDD
ncbi:hypothetical protein TIFTF001_005515 [Ficus carica]|uniref:Uncharacterized protein n=1 Tax=Ficus carica TaxID=3494 RepID=A0AA87ZLV4_FICCA|nr:hypothetical protein TIFTF001_005515 [Ficus carica]